jgi:hypothetical protein
MRKLLALGLVLGMASIANAGFVLTVNNEPAPGEITLTESETIEIDVDLPDGSINSAYDVVLELSNDKASFAVPYFFEGTPPFYQDAEWKNITIEADYTLLSTAPFGGTQNEQYIRVGGAMSAGPPPDFLFGPADVFSGIMLHCDGFGDVTLTLKVGLAAGNVFYDSAGTPEEWQDGGIMDTLIIHQIPEPMTMALLGLGGLALLRRRR